MSIQGTQRQQNDTGNQHERYSLKFGNKRAENTGIPLLDPFYSYLLVLSEGVGIVDLYPWLAELLFHSVAVQTRNGQVNPNEAAARPINLIGFFIDDHQNSLAATISKEYLFEKPHPFLSYKRNLLLAKKVLKQETMPRHFIIDTFGEFGDPGNGWELPEDTEDEQELAKGVRTCFYRPVRVVGSGNPMQLMRRFTEIGEVPRNHFGDCANQGLGVLNCFLLNSISNLYRTMGLRDAMQFVRVLLKAAVWKPPPDPPEAGLPVAERKLIHRDGMLFATLHEGVFSDTEMRYVETFFDGVVRFFVHWEESGQTADKRTAYFVERLPPEWQSGREKTAEEGRFHQPMAYKFHPGERMKPKPLSGYHRKSRVPSSIEVPEATKSPQGNDNGTA